MTDVTGERLIPDAQHGELVHAEHLARYRFAAGLAGRRRVLDAASGEGYGSALLAAAGAASVTGIDIDETTVNQARERYGLDFVAADVASLPFSNGAFDLVVCFETIEHVRDPAAAIVELNRVLHPSGLLVISTPNKHEYLVDNPFHTREFFHQEFVELLRQHFGDVRVLYQHNWLTSAVLAEADFTQSDGNTPVDMDVYKVRAGDPARELYTVAVCGEDVGDSLRQTAVVAGTDEAHALALRTIAAEDEARKWHDEYRKASDTAELWHLQFNKMSESARIVEAQYKAVVDSRSWRWTQPLRRLGGALKGRNGR